MSKFTFSGTARPIGRVIGDDLIVEEVGVWTDGVGVFADNHPNCAYVLQKGLTYKITIELIGEQNEL